MILRTRTIVIVTCTLVVSSIVLWLLWPELTYRFSTDMRAASLNQQMDFYGLVLEQQTNKPIAGARVEYHVNGITGKMLRYENNNNQIKGYIETDKTGRFSILKQEGVQIGIDKIAKSGYLPCEGKIYTYIVDPNGSVFKPDTSSPEIYTLWRKGQTEPLIVEENLRAILKFSDDFSALPLPYLSEYFTNKNTPSNSFEKAIEIKVLPIGFNPEKSDQWMYILHVNNGGIQETHDYFPYLPPEDKYLPEYSEAISRYSTSLLKRRFYFYFESCNVYGMLEILLTDRPDSVVIRYSYYLNPSGSRNLEVDENKTIRFK